MYLDLNELFLVPKRFLHEFLEIILFLCFLILHQEIKVCNVYKNRDSPFLDNFLNLKSF